VEIFQWVLTGGGFSLPHIPDFVRISRPVSTGGDISCTHTSRPVELFKWVLTKAMVFTAPNPHSFENFPTFFHLGEGRISCPHTPRLMEIFHWILTMGGYFNTPQLRSFEGWGYFSALRALHQPRYFAFFACFLYGSAERYLHEYCVFATRSRLLSVRTWFCLSMGVLRRACQKLYFAKTGFLKPQV